jgi:hypothetical protein
MSQQVMKAFTYSDYIITQSLDCGLDKSVKSK